MHRTLVRALFGAACAVSFGLGFLGVRGWSEEETFVQHDGGEYRFRYPARWTLQYDTFDVATPDSRIVALQGPDGSVLMVHSFVPASHLSAQQFADEIGRQRRVALADLGVQGGEIQRQVPERVRIAGALRDAVRQEFEIASGGLRFAQIALFVRLDLGDEELFFSLHSPAYHAARAESAFAAVLGSLEIESPRTASNRPIRPAP